MIYAGNMSQMFEQRSSYKSNQTESKKGDPQETWTKDSPKCDQG